MLEAEGIVKEFGAGGRRVRALKGVSLCVREGESVGLVGETGSGKTTLAKVMMGLIRPEGGSVRARGTPLESLTAAGRRRFRREFQMVFQQPLASLDPNFTVEQTLAEPLAVHAFPGDERQGRIRRTLEAVGLLPEVLEKWPAQLSGGQRQRVAIARGLVRDPQVFLFDEPLSNLDAQLRTQTRAEIKKLQQQLATTAVYVTHDRTEAMTLGDRIAVMKDGRLQQVDEPLAMYHKPATLFVANFIGTPGINQFRGRLRHAHGKFTFRHHDLELDLHHRYKVPEREPEVVLGVRPEDMELESSRDKGFKASVDLVEQLGGESLIYATLADDTKVVARTEGNVRYDQGAVLKLGFKPEAAHLFDAATEMRIE